MQYGLDNAHVVITTKGERTSALRTLEDYQGSSLADSVGGAAAASATCPVYRKYSVLLHLHSDAFPGGIFENSYKPLQRYCKRSELRVYVYEISLTCNSDHSIPT